MSIATAIEQAQQKVSTAYTACEEKGATMPESGNRNLSQLASTIRTIPTNSGNTVVANPTVPSGVTPTTLTGLQVDSNYYLLPTTTLSTTKPQGGFEPNVVYDLGTLTGNTTFALASLTDNTIPNPYHWTFETGSTAPTITWPNGLTWAGGTAPVIAANKHYEILVRNGYASALEF